MGFLAFEGFEEELTAELLFLEAPILVRSERFFIIHRKSNKSVSPVWAQLILSSVQFFEIESIKDASKKLKTKNSLWAHYSTANHRRAELIQSELLPVKNPLVEFNQKLKPRNIGFWSLVEKNLVAYCESTNSPFPLGHYAFVENKKLPPSRAYLKLWEALTLHQLRVKKGSRVLDFGSCPGGWTWVLQSLGCRVVSIDRSPLAPEIAKLEGVEFIQRNAFTLKPQDLGPIDWFFSDIICYPEKLYELITEWRASGLCKNFVCTIKYQGAIDFKATELFQKIPGSKVVHLLHNKHEVTWILNS